jgi:thiamine-phosphate pyrophosphorylase
MERFTRTGLYLVTSEEFSAGKSTVHIVQAALAGGVKLVQLREKALSSRDLLSLARCIRELTAASEALLIINDRLDIALACDADGVHLGQEDLPVRDARRLAPDMIIGASSHNATQAVEAETQGASYVNIGPLFPTDTKNWRREFLGVDGLKQISKKLTIPFTVMGGIKKEHVAELCAAGARTIAVVTAVTAAGDPRAAAAELVDEIRRGRSGEIRS